MLNKKSFINRLWVGALIFLAMLGMIALDIYFPNYANDPASENKIVSGRAINAVIISALILLSVVEMRRALGTERIPDCFSWLLWLYGFGLGPSYSLFGFNGIIFFTMLVFIGAVLTSLIKNRIDSLIYVAFMLLYPGLFMATLLYINRASATHYIDPNSPMYQYLENDIWSYISTRRTSNLLPLNAIALTFVFAVSSFTDVFAYLVGSLFGKHKLCPEISPKKTVEGSIGGIFGGIFGAALVYFLFDFFPLFAEDMHFGLTFPGLGLNTWHVVITYVIIAIGGSLATQIGDLVASQIKRYCGIKDYSRVLGAHGGIMDRFDGIILNSVFVSFIFMFIL